MNDLRFALRSLLRAPAFSIAIVLTLALGIGSASAIFSVVDRILFRPPPYPHPEQLHQIGFKLKQIDFQPYVYAVEYCAYRTRTDLIEALPAFCSTQANLVVNGAPVGVNAASVTVDYFGTFGATMLLGRGFVPGEDQPGSDDVVVISHQLWRQRFGSDPHVLNQSVLLAGKSCRVIGVLPVDVSLPNVADTYQPLRIVSNAAAPFTPSVFAFARLREGVTREQALSQIGSMKIDVGADHVRAFNDRTLRLRAVVDQYRMGGKQAQWALLAAVGFLYAIACTNAANLMLARIHGRRKELSVRQAIGCSRSGLVALVATEALVLTTLAGALGIVIARWVFPVLLWLADRSGVEANGPSSLDWRALAFTIVLAVVTSVVISIAPALRIATANVTSGLKDSGQAQGESPGLRRIRSGLVVLEAALAVVLLVGAGLMTRTVDRLVHFDRGIDPAQKAAVTLIIPKERVASPDASRNLFLQVTENLKSVPGVQAVSIASMVPLADVSVSTRIRKADGTEHFAHINIVSPAYKRLLGLPIVKGRWFDDDSRPGDPPVVVLSETMARLMFGDADPIGQPFLMDTRDKTRTPWIVIGVARDLVDSPRHNPRPLFYLPDTQPSRWNSPRTFVTVLLRTSQPMNAATADAIRRAVYAVDPLIATMAPRSLSEGVEKRISQERYTLTVLRVLSGLSLGLAVAGLFAVMTYTVSQRMGEFGVRVALGALPEQVFRLVLWRGIGLVAIGVSIGAAAAWAFTRLIRSMLYQTSTLDPTVYGIVALLLLGAALFGCWLPARRAMRVDVAKLLRSE